jgi:hypothetical protein
MKTILFIVLGVIEIFVALGALYGGWNLMTDPTGKSMQMPLEWLKRSPFPNYLIPGIVLFAVNGIGSAFAAVVSFLRIRTAGWLGVLIGLFLFLWICVQVYYVGLALFLQPMFAAVGLVELHLGIALLRMTRTK